MARDEAPPFARGETWYNGGAIDATDNTTLGGVNLEGKEFVFEVNSQDQGTGYPTGQDETGRKIVVKVVRNSSGVNLKPARLAHFGATSAYPYGTRVDGYCISAASRPAGVVDEFLPAAGVPPNDLFYLVKEGPTQFTNQTAAPITTAIGDRLVPATTGATAGDPLGGRVALFSSLVTAASTCLGTDIANAVQHSVGYAAAVNSTTASVFNGFASLKF